MDNAGYTALTRQSGLMREMQTVANNLANMSTSGYRREGLIFAEHVKRLEGENDSLSMATANVKNTSLMQGTLTQTAGTFDFAIEGAGFFLIETPAGERLTRAGSFTPSPEGELVTPEGYRLLDNGGSPVFVPPDAPSINLAADGTLSAGNTPLAQIGLYSPADPNQMRREDGVRFISDAGTIPVEGSAILQGFIESSNVDPVAEITRMIEVQRAYELGQGFMDKEDERIRSVMRTLGSS
ncbi:flagellar hook-basal body complex protein [Halocynthiibacter namhaensis]|uniref:flagellar hook-basal body complex protein n=1 Tax=Halocynthiibacter namhaensis TaxID=1290553 RepID=UPI00057920A5|nr:flagellar hook-basal body complex protein [Halocynthiibacter namhaensis]